jgi:hypothetical protein
MSPVAGFVLLAGAVVAIAKRLADPALDRLGERLADWLFPTDRPTTYRLARGICWLSRLIAPRTTAAAAGIEAVFGDIDAIQSGNHTYGGPIALARSTLPPALRARRKQLLLLLAMITVGLFEAVGVTLAFPVSLTLISYIKATGNLLPGDSTPPSRGERRFWRALIVFGHGCLVAVAVFLGPIPVRLFSLDFFVLTLPFFYVAGCAAIADIASGIWLVVEQRRRSRS